MAAPRKAVVAEMKRRRIRLLSLLLACPLLLLLLNFSVGKIQRYIYPMKYQEIVNDMAEEYQLDPSLVFAVIHTESKFDQNALSSAQAKGLMQITDDTFRWAQKRAGEQEMNPENLYIPKTNIRYGCYILVLLSEQFDDIETVLAAYNAGQGRVLEWLNNTDYSKDGKTLHTIPYEETEDYVRRVLNTQKRYQRIYNIQ